jgi:mannose-1-phosphate guanylyltransferase
MTGEVRAACLRSVDVLVLAGGLGTRLRPAIGERPKLLAPVRGRPYVLYLLDWLRRFDARRIVLSLGYKADSVLDFLAARHFDALEIVPVVEPEPLGTAGAVRFARLQLHSDPVLVMNGDSYIDTDLCALLSLHRGSGALGTLLCADVEDAGRFGRLTVNRTGRISSFIEKDPDFRGRAVVSAGIYALSAYLLDDIAAGTARSLEREVFAALPPESLGALVGSSGFVDIGTPESLAAAEALFPRPAD